MFSDAADAQQQSLSPTHALFDVPHSPFTTSPLEENEERCIAGQDAEVHDSDSESEHDSNIVPHDAEVAAHPAS